MVDQFIFLRKIEPFTLHRFRAEDLGYISSFNHPFKRQKVLLIVYIDYVQYNMTSIRYSRCQYSGFMFYGRQ